MQESLDIIFSPPEIQTFTLSGIVQDAATGNALPDVAVTATFRSNNRALLTRFSHTTSGDFAISFEQSQGG